jgi:hypothetical protein
MLDKMMHTGTRDERLVCVKCFNDRDLRRVISHQRQTGRCAFCGSRKIAVMPLWGMADYLEGLMRANYGQAVDELPYESREGGYQGSWTSSTWELLIEDIGVPLVGPGEVKLGQALAEQIGDEVWCSLNWTTLDPDESLRFSWEEFCTIVKHQRRFFFQSFGKGRYDGVDDRSPAELLDEIRDLVDAEGLVREFPAGLKLHRARPRKRGVHYVTAEDLGPAPVEFALQTNRMNPPGIPMLYGADNRKLALAEVRQSRVSMGMFKTTRPANLLDLTRLPRVPGFFAGGSRTRRLKLAFLHDFAAEIVKPIPRDDRNHIDYLPTQVFTEFLRDADFGGVRIDGMRYRSATGEDGTNFVLFATRGDVEGVAPDDLGAFTVTPKPWLRLTKVRQV